MNPAEKITLDKNLDPARIIGKFTELDYELQEVVNWNPETLELWLSKKHGTGKPTVECLPRWEGEERYFHEHD